MIYYVEYELTDGNREIKKGYFKESEIELYSSYHNPNKQMVSIKVEDDDYGKLIEIKSV